MSKLIINIKSFLFNFNPFWLSFLYDHKNSWYEINENLQLINKYTLLSSNSNKMSFTGRLRNKCS